jgi:hypothetical protein
VAWTSHNIYICNQIRKTLWSFDDNVSDCVLVVKIYHAFISTVLFLNFVVYDIIAVLFCFKIIIIYYVNKCSHWKLWLAYAQSLVQTNEWFMNTANRCTLLWLVSFGVCLLFQDYHSDKIHPMACTILPTKLHVWD